MSVLLPLQSLFLLFLFSSLTAVAGTSKTILNNSGEGGHPCLVSDFRGNAFSFYTIEYTICCGFAIHGFYYDEVCFFCAYILQSYFNHKWVLNFFKDILCIYCGSHVFLSFNLLKFCITLTDL